MLSLCRGCLYTNGVCASSQIFVEYILIGWDFTPIQRNWCTITWHNANLAKKTFSTMSLLYDSLSCIGGCVCICIFLRVLDNNVSIRFLRSSIWLCSIPSGRHVQCQLENVRYACAAQHTHTHTQSFITQARNWSIRLQHLLFTGAQIKNTIESIETCNKPKIPV